MCYMNVCVFVCVHVCVMCVGVMCMCCVCVCVCVNVSTAANGLPTCACINAISGVPPIASICLVL